MARKLTLTQRVVGFSLVGLIAMGWGAIFFSEKLVEEVILDQARRQAKMFLMGVEQEIKARQGLENDKLLRTILSKSHLMMKDELIFSVDRIYIYDSHGKVLGDSSGKFEDVKDLAGYHGEVFRSGASYLGDEIVYEDSNGLSIPKTDIIIPIHDRGEVVGALEAEIDLLETMAQIQYMDDKYERYILTMFSFGGGGLLLFIWWVMHSNLIRPLNSLLRVTKAISKGQFGRRASKASSYEVARLGRAVNTMASSIEDLMAEQDLAYMQAMQALAKALETKDKYTAGHSGRVAHYSVKLGHRLGLDERQLMLLRQGALMHDLGKIGIPDSVLNKAGSLSDSEFEQMRAHPSMTATIMRPLKRFKEFAEIAAWHHERWDGQGYPDGLKGEEIPLLARIVSIADTWDAMIGDRVYRRGLSIDKALGILEDEKDSGQWDPQLIREFVGLISDEQRVRHIHCIDENVLDIKSGESLRPVPLESS